LKCKITENKAYFKTCIVCNKTFSYGERVVYVGTTDTHRGNVRILTHVICYSSYVDSVKEFEQDETLKKELMNLVVYSL